MRSPQRCWGDRCGRKLSLHDLKHAKPSVTSTENQDSHCRIKCSGDRLHARAMGSMPSGASIQVCVHRLCKARGLGLMTTSTCPIHEHGARYKLAVALARERYLKGCWYLLLARVFEDLVSHRSPLPSIYYKHNGKSLKQDRQGRQSSSGKS